MSTSAIDWSRLAEPQLDQYDTKVILHLATSTTSTSRPQKYTRTPVGLSPAVFDGQVAVRHVYRPLLEFSDAPTDHPNIGLAVEYVRRWPVIFRQCQQLLEAIHPVLHPQIPLESNQMYRGSVCHSEERLFGTMWATIFCPLGLAEAIIQELAHQKLRVLGVAHNASTAIVQNDPAELHSCAVVKDQLQPLTAVLHEEYAYVHVTALDIEILRTERDTQRRAVIKEVLERNLQRVEAGHDTLQKHFRAGEHGQDFINGFFDWTERTIGAAKDMLNGSRTRSTANVSSNTPANLINAARPVVFAYNGGIGDRLCNLPALRALAALFQGRLSLLCFEGDRDLYYSDLNLRAVYECNFEYAEIGFEFDVDEVARHLINCDLFLSINPWHSGSLSELLSRFSGIPSVGFFPEFSHNLPCDYEGHAMDMAFAIPGFFGNSIDLTAFSNPPAISEKAASMAQEFKRRYANWRYLLFVHADTKPEKSWPRVRFEAVLDRFLESFPDFGALIVDVSGEGNWRSRFPDRIAPVTLPLDACFALLRESHLFLGIDSCHLHAADLFRVPGVALFGPSTSRRWGYKFCKHRHLQSSARMDDIGVDDVYEALCSLIDSRV